MNPLEKAYWTAKGVGWDNVPRRTLYIMMRNSGLLRKRLPTEANTLRGVDATVIGNDSKAKWQERSARFFPVLERQQLRKLIPESLWDDKVGEECRQALAGHYPYFSHWTAQLGWPPNFNRDPVNEVDWPVGVHWLQTARSGPPRNDIKLVWEPSRLSLAYSLARHYRYTGDTQWAEAFWTLVDSWIEQNPINLTVAWGCGQEVAFRLMAILFGTFVTLDSDSASEARLRSITKLCHLFATRIAGNINYAISQENNHAFSEALGLWTVGLLFPEFSESAKWLQLSRRVILHEADRQIYPDGSYIQHSMVYHRVMLDDLSWIIALGKINHVLLPAQLVERFGRAARWLCEFIEPESGRVPNYGANDGANVLPLACCDYLDFRPTAQLACQVAEENCPVSTGIWSEKAMWLTGTLPKQMTVTRTCTWNAPNGGYHVLRGPQTYLMIRATSYRDRPSQCDQLHVDLWYKSHNILRDAGSFYYYHTDANIKNYFYSTEAHNTVKLPGVEQMEKGLSFLWLRWPNAMALAEGENKLNCRGEFRTLHPYIHHREIERVDDNYCITDSVSAKGTEEDSLDYRVLWRLAPNWEWNFAQPQILQGTLGDETVCLAITGAGVQQITLSDSWESLYYGRRRQCPQLQIEAKGKVITTFSLISSVV
jgi:hypothetical protein